jgi:hypothetical protein
MGTGPRPRSKQTLARAVQQSILAPSVHNTPPWRFIIGLDNLEVLADRTRQLAVLDPTGRELLISCGAALLNARIALSVDGYPPQVER